MMKKYLLILSIISCVLYADANQSTPLELGYKQIKLGMSPEEIKALPGLYFSRCDTSVCIEDSMGNTLGGSILKRPVLIMMNKNHQAGSINLYSNSDNFSKISLAYITKYGEPIEKTDAVVQNRMGAEFSNKKYRWKNSEGQIILQERAGKVDQMSINIVSNDYLEASKKSFENEVKKSASDL